MANINSTGELNATDPDNDALTYNFTSPLNSSGMWQTDYRSSGTYVVTVTVSDSSLTDSQNVTIIVLEIEDVDNDGLNDSSDFVLGNASSINTTLTNINILINGTGNLTKLFNGSFTVNITNSSKSLVEFEWNFSNSSLLNFSEITINKQSNTSTKGSIIISGLNLTTQDQTKTVYVDDLDAGISTLCLKDADITDINDVSASCNSQNETLITCDGTLQADRYNCTSADNNTRHKITGLSYSGVIEQCADSDADGYYISGCTGGTDCNDNNANVNPGQSEVCDNGIDDDCDGSTDEGCGGGGGGGGGGGLAITSAPSAIAAHKWSTIKKDTKAVMRISSSKIAFKNLSVFVKSSLDNVEISVEKLDDKPKSLNEPSQNVYQYLQITETNIFPRNIRSVAITFNVGKEWLENNSISQGDIRLYKWKTTDWSELLTKELSEDSLYVYYSAKSPGLSYFAVSGKKNEKIIKEVSQQPAVENMSVGQINISERHLMEKNKTRTELQQLSQQLPPEEKKEEVEEQEKKPWTGKIIIMLIVVLGLIFYIYYKKPIKK